MFIPKGSLAFVGNGLVDLRTARGAALGTPDLGTSAAQHGAATLDNGIFAADDLFASVKVFTPLLASIGSVSFTGTSSMGESNGLYTGSLASSQSAFYAARGNWNGTKFVSTIKRVSDAGADVQTWTLPDAGLGSYPGDTMLLGFCVSWDGQTLYYNARNRNDDVIGVIRRFDLNTSTALSALASDTTLGPHAYLGMADGSVVSVWSYQTTTQLRVYSSTGALLRSRSMPTDLARLTRGPDDLTVWLWLGQVVSLIRVSDLAILDSVPAADGPNAGVALFSTRQNAGARLVSVMFGAGKNIRVDGSDVVYGVGPQGEDLDHWLPFDSGT